MPSREDADLTTFEDNTLGKNTTTIEGVLDYISWWHRPPRLYFYDWPIHSQGIPLTHFIGEEVEITIKQPELCTVCGEPSSSSPCADCGTEPPFATCVKQPAQACTYDNCPFETFKAKNCSEQFTIYLTASDRIKIGITKSERLRTRWCEQGATHGIRIATARHRYEAGRIEAAIDLAREELSAVIGTPVLSQSRQTWSEPLSDPIDTLASATILAGDHFPTDLTSRFRFSDRDRDAIREAIQPIKAISSGDLDDAFPHRKIGGLSHISEGESVAGRFVGVRGRLLVTEAGYLNCNTHGGYRVRIKTSAPYTDYLTDVADPLTAVHPETDSHGMLSSAVQNHTNDSEGAAPAADFM